VEVEVSLEKAGKFIVTSAVGVSKVVGILSKVSGLQHYKLS
jgi:hypothetical protein